MILKPTNDIKAVDLIELVDKTHTIRLTKKDIIRRMDLTCIEVRDGELYWVFELYTKDNLLIMTEGLKNDEFEFIQ